MHISRDCCKCAFRVLDPLPLQLLLIQLRTSYSHYPLARSLSISLALSRSRSATQIEHIIARTRVWVGVCVLNEVRYYYTGSSTADPNTVHSTTFETERESERASERQRDRDSECTYAQRARHVNRLSPPHRRTGT